MKIKTSSFAAALAVLLAFCLVFMAPVGAADVAQVGEQKYSSIGAAITDNPDAEDKTVIIIGDATGHSGGIERVYSYWSGWTIKGSETGKISCHIASHTGDSINSVTFTDLRFENDGRIAFTNPFASINGLTIKNCTFVGQTTNPIYIKEPTSSGTLSITILNNTFSGSKGILINAPNDKTSGTVIIKDNIVEAQSSNAFQIQWPNSATSMIKIVNNTFSSVSNRPVNIANIESSTFEFKQNKLYFPASYVDNDITTPNTPAIYNLKSLLVLDNTNEFYRDNVKLTTYSELMKHLYPVENGVIIIDGVKEGDEYVSGYMSAGIPGTGTNENHPLLKTGYNFAKVYSSSDDGDNIGHYIIGEGAVSNNEMKLTAGTFSVDPTAFIANGYHVKTNNDDTFTVTDQWDVIITAATGGTIEASPASAKAGDEITLTATPNEGYVFKEWTVTSGSVIITDNKFTMPESNVEITAVFEPQTPEDDGEEDGEGDDTPSVEINDRPSSGGKDTGSGNFAEYPRQADGTAGEIDFGSSKDVKSVDLPEGVTGAVTLVAKSNQPAPEGKDTHKVFEINIPNYPTGKPATIKFEMTLAEIEAKGLTAADVCLYHFDKETGVWTKLTTTYKVVDGKVYFEAVTTGFSPFAIVFEEGAATPAESEDEPVTPPTDEPQDVPGEVLPEIPPVDEPETPATPAPILAVLAGLGAAVVLRRK